MTVSKQSNEYNPVGRPTLGVVAISFNEQRDLPVFIEHLLPWVDEVVIVDDGSTDETFNIASSYGDKVWFILSPRAENEYFSHQRNKGIDAAKSDWLLHMDIDERVTPALAQEILEVVQNPKMDAFKFRRLNFFLHRPMKGGGWQDWNLVHLARKAVFRFGGMFHEDCIVDTSSERIGQLEEYMWHLNDENYLERMRKSNLYCTEQARRIIERGIQIRWWHFLLLPLKEFLKKFLKRHGYRDGTLGLLFALHASAAMFKASSLVWDQQNRVSRSAIENEIRNAFRESPPE